MTLTAKHKISVEDWMNSPFIKRVFNALQGSETKENPQALLVGGCVRNAVLGKDVDDIDIATPLKPQEVIKIMAKENIKVIPTGIKHATLTLVDNNDPAAMRCEITTLRRDDKTDGRHAQISCTKSWHEDAKRRDFTLNTLLMDLNGNIYDPLGCALQATRTGNVRFVGKASQRIKEDYLRILRFFRFNAYYSQSQNYDREGLKACSAAAQNIYKLSKERITQEFFKIISAPQPAGVLDVMFSHDILKDLQSKDYNPKLLEHVCSFQSSYSLQAISARLLVFAGLDMNNLDLMRKYILIPKIFIKDMECILGSLRLDDLSCDNAIYESLYRFGRIATAQAFMIELAQDRVMNGFATAALDIIQKFKIPDFPVTGDDLIKRGFKTGPEIGKELSRLEQLWIDNGFSMPLGSVP